VRESTAAAQASIETVSFMTSSNRVRWGSVELNALRLWQLGGV
jgi:hypothetical protein